MNSISLIAVAEDQISRRLQVLLLPIEFELLVFGEQMVQTEIHRPHVQRSDFRLKGRCRLDPFFDAHIGAAAGGDVDRSVRALLDARQEAGEGLRRLIRLAGLGIAGVQVEDRGAGLRRCDRLNDDLVRRDRQIRRHGRRMDRAGDRAGDDDLVGGSHSFPFLPAVLQAPMSRAARRLCAASAIRRRSRHL